MGRTFSAPGRPTGARTPARRRRSISTARVRPATTGSRPVGRGGGHAGQERGETAPSTGADGTELQSRCTIPMRTACSTACVRSRASSFW